MGGFVETHWHQQGIYKAEVPVFLLKALHQQVMQKSITSMKDGIGNEYIFREF